LPHSDKFGLGHRRPPRFFLSHKWFGGRAGYLGTEQDGGCADKGPYVFRYGDCARLGVAVQRQVWLGSQTRPPRFFFFPPMFRTGKGPRRFGYSDRAMPYSVRFALGHRGAQPGFLLKCFGQTMGLIGFGTETTQAESVACEDRFSPAPLQAYPSSEFWGGPLSGWRMGRPKGLLSLFST